MKFGKAKINYKNFMSFPSNERINFFEKKIKFRDSRTEMLESIAKSRFDTNPDFQKELNLKEALFYLSTMTNCFFDEAEYSYENNWIDTHLCETTALVISYLPYLKDESSEDEKEDYNLKNVEIYYSILEKIVFNADEIYTKDKKRDKFSTFTSCMSEVSKSLSISTIPYNGKAIKISGKVGTHDPSIILLPKNPQEAIASIYDDERDYSDGLEGPFGDRKIRTLFSEFGGEESAETFVTELYGTDGRYGQHYQKLINCKEHYTNKVQKPS